MNKIIVIGGAHHNTLGVVRSLGEVGLSDVIVLLSVSSHDNFVCKSKYVRKENVYKVQNEEDIVDKVFNIAKAQEEKSVVICCGDSFIGVIDDAYDLLSPYCILPTTNEQGRITYFLDKEKQCKLAEASGLKTPLHFLLNDREMYDLTDFPYPCIVKPTNSIVGKKGDIVICSTKEKLEDYLSNMKLHSLRIEEYITKTMEFQLIGCSLEQKIIIPGYTTIIRQPKNTNTGYLKYLPIQNGVVSAMLIEKVERFIREIGYKGLFSVEFIRDASGNDYFLEINMRNDGNAYCVQSAGVNLPNIWYRYAANPIAEIEEPMSFVHPIYWMPEFNDAYNIFNVGVLQWMKECFTADAHSIFDKCDLVPFLYAFYSKAKRKIIG